MRRFLTALVLFFSLAVVPVAAQSSDVSKAQQLSQTLSRSQELPSNVRLRFELLGDKVDVLGGKGDPSKVLGFFSDTRVMVWNQQVAPSTEQSMRQLEQEMVKLAKQRGINLDLPPVGFAPRVGGSRLLSSERVTAGGLSNLVLQTEQIATELLQQNQSAELLFLRDGLTSVREDLADGDVASDRIRILLGARARFLAGDASRITDPRLQEKLLQLGEVLRSLFPPERLRATRGQQISL